MPDGTRQYMFNHPNQKTFCRWELRKREQTENEDFMLQRIYYHSKFAKQYNTEAKQIVFITKCYFKIDQSSALLQSPFETYCVCAKANPEETRKVLTQALLSASAQYRQTLELQDESIRLQAQNDRTVHLECCI